MLENSETFGIGTLTTGVAPLVNANSVRKYVITMFRLVKKNNLDAFINIFIKTRGGNVRLLPVDFNIDDSFIVDILEPGHTLVLHNTDSIYGNCSISDTVDYVITGELHEDLR